MVCNVLLTGTGAYLSVNPIQRGIIVTRQCWGSMPHQNHPLPTISGAQ